jgi:hypothetical protein
MCRGHPAHLRAGERMAVLLGYSVCLRILYGFHNESVVTRPCCVPACRRGPGPPERLAESCRSEPHTRDCASLAQRNQSTPLTCWCAQGISVSRSRVLPPGRGKGYCSPKGTTGLCFEKPLRSMRDPRGAQPLGFPEADTQVLAGASTKLMPVERSSILPPLALLAQTTLDKILYAQSIHCADAHGGHGTVEADCHTCVALYEAVSAARIAAVETTTLPQKVAQRRTKTTRKGSRRTSDDV